MFGESESESPRTGSPWDSFLSKSDPASPAVEPARSPRVVPKLVPEVEEGNVEYKLRLLNPTTERFTRLVTQLKWRLLEGGGQAYYELGVADSGQLVGLSRTHLEQSLQTLEEMAGEIGASVIVVKEIELPPALLEAVKKDTDAPRGKIADGATRMHKVRVADYVETPPSSAGADEEAELSAPEGEAVRLAPGEVNTLNEDNDSISGDDSGTVGADLEIASVYKPRPHRRRTPIPMPTPPRSNGIRCDDALALDLASLHVASSPRTVPNAAASKKAIIGIPHTPVPRLIVDSGSGSQSDADSETSPTVSGVDTIGTSEHLKALDDLEAAAAMLSINDAPPSESGNALSPASEAASHSVATADKAVCIDVMHNGILTPDNPTERRFIVEALVVRKMSIEEGFLDFMHI